MSWQTYRLQAALRSMRLKVGPHVYQAMVTHCNMNLSSSVSA